MLIDECPGVADPRGLMRTQYPLNILILKVKYPDREILLVGLATQPIFWGLFIFLIISST